MEVLIFRLGKSEWALPVQQVRQVLPPAPETRLPGAAPPVRGLIAWRGKVLPVLAVGTNLGSADPPAGHGHLLIVKVSELAALPVDEVRHVALAQPTIGGQQVEVEGGYVSLLDIERVLA